MKLILEVYEWLKKTLRPPSAFSWETLILLSLFSYYMSILATDIPREFLINFAWIFLILGVYWATMPAKALRYGYKDPQSPGFPFSPWITGALVSIYIFGRDGDVSADALVSWPIISAVIAALPLFFGEGFKPRTPTSKERQNLVVLFGTQLLLSCWFQFYFVIQNWLVDYPSLLSDEFYHSAFVIKRESRTSELPRGALLLNSMESKLVEQLDSKPWPEVERSLLQQQRTELINQAADQAMEQVESKPEDELWLVSSKVSSRNAGYNLDLQALWQGPRSDRQEEYTLTKSCQITQVSPQPTPITDPNNVQQGQPFAPISNFECQPIQGWGIQEEPTTASNTSVQS